MPKFKYIARDHNGKKIRGVYTAENILEFYNFIEVSGLFLIKNKIIDDTKSSKNIFKFKVSKKDLITSFEVLIVLLRSGVPLVDALNDTSSGIKNKQLSNIFKKLKEQINSGNTLSDACKNFPEAFDPQMVEAFKIGETTGQLEETLKNQIERLKEEEQLKKTIKGQSIYPIILILMIIGVFSMMSFFFFPRMLSSYKEILGSKPIPPNTKFFIDTNNFIVHKGWLIITGLFSIIFGWLSMNLHPSTKKIKDLITNKIFILKNLIKYIHLAQISQNLKIGLQSGMGIKESLEITRNGISNYVFRQFLLRVENMLLAGATLSQCVSSSPESDFVFSALIRAGEISGRLVETLDQSYRYYSTLVKDYLKIAVNAFNYIVLLMLGAMITYTILSIIIPIYELPSALTG